VSVVTIAEAWPAAGRPFTVAELDRMPDDGRRYELLDGVLVVSPWPTTLHQFVAMRLARVLDAACPGDLCVVRGPAVELGPQTELDPDLVVVRTDQIGGAKFTEPPLLIVEIRSPSTALVDLNRKKAAYERFGVPSYWIVNPDLDQPELTIFELRDGQYVVEAKTTGPIRASRPFNVTVDPARLIAGLRRLVVDRSDRAAAGHDRLAVDRDAQR
jgi:Uma2 family endonuclease